MWENRYRQFKDKRWNRTCGRRGTNQKVEPHMWENVPPNNLSELNDLNSLISSKNLYFKVKMYIFDGLLNFIT